MSKELKVIEQLDSEVLSVIGSENIQGFQKAYLVAEATGKLKDLLTREYMNPIMNLQGNRLGFRTDKDRDGGYPMETVKNCLIEAVLMGVQPVGNQFNIIAGNSYITKEGFGYLLSKIPELSYEIIPDLPRVNNTNTSAAIDMHITWQMNGGSSHKRTISIPIKVNKMMGTDAIIGKATRKARAWLHGTITGSEISDGDIGDLDSPKTINVEVQSAEEERKRALEFINKAESKKELQELKGRMSKELQEDMTMAFENRENELIIEQNK